MVDNSKRIDELKKELAKDPRSRQFYQLGELLRREGRLGEAAEVLRGGLKHHPKYVAAWVALGRTCLDLGHGREGEAAEALTQALGLDAHNPVAWRLLGEARLACGQRQAALEAMEQALALVPGDEVLKAAVEALQVEVARSAPPAAPLPAPVASQAAAPSVPVAPPPEPMPAEEAPFDFDTAPLDLGPPPVASILEPVPAIPVPPGGEVFDVFGEPAGPEAREEELAVETAAASALSSPGEVLPPEPVLELAPPAVVPAAEEAPAEMGETAEAVPAPALAPSAEDKAAPEGAEEPAGVPPVVPAPEQTGPLPEPVLAAPAGERLEPPEAPMPEPVGAPPSEPSVGTADGGPVASLTLARLYLRQQQMGAAVEVLETLLQRQPDNQEARELLGLVHDMLEVAPAASVPTLSPAERKIASLQRWLARVQAGRERIAP